VVAGWLVTFPPAVAGCKLPTCSGWLQTSHL
jgi:hypothetical protein